MIQNSPSYISFLLFLSGSDPPQKPLAATGADPGLIFCREEERFYCIGRVDDGIVTVRFTFRENVIRLFGAGYWRRGKKIYEEKNKIHR